MAPPLGAARGINGRSTATAGAPAHSILASSSSSLGKAFSAQAGGNATDGTRPRRPLSGHAASGRRKGAVGGFASAASSIRVLDADPARRKCSVH